MKRFLIAFSRKPNSDASDSAFKFSVRELPDEVSSHALLCPPRTFMLYEAQGESIDDIYAKLNTIRVFNSVILDFTQFPTPAGKIYMFGKFISSPDGKIVYNTDCRLAIPVESLSSNFVIVDI